MHSLAIQDPIFQKASKLFLSQAETDSQKKEALTCTRCHTPAGHLSGEVVTTESDYTSIGTPFDGGIFCDFCHSVKASAGIGNAPFMLEPGAGLQQPGVKRGPFQDAVSPFHGTAYSSLHTRAEFCGMCHEARHASFGTSIETTYTEWRDSPYNTGDPATTVVCQDCHMRQHPGVPATGSTARPDNPGKAATGGPDRPNIYTHYFVGGNSIVTALSGSKTIPSMAEDRLKNAATVDIITTGVWRRGSQASFEVKVSNVGAGHYLPTGITEVRQMWLEVSVTDASGREVFHSGALDAGGKLDPRAVIFKTVLGDASGKPTDNVALATQVLSDHRIPPKGSDTSGYTFSLPADASAPLTVKATLRYRSASQELANELLGSEAPSLPVVDMASVSKTLPTVE
jgi:hypothetical protein